MRIVKGKANKGGKSHKKATEKNHLEAKHKAANAVIQNLLAQMRKMEVDCIRYALKNYLGEAGVDITKVKKLREKDKQGYILEYDGVKLGRIENQHSKEVVKDMPNFRVIFTQFDVKEQTPLKVA